MRRLVIVGAGMAALRLVEELRARSTDDHVTLLCGEDHAPYNRILLSAVLEGTHRPEALALRPPEWYDAHDVDLRLGARVLEIDRERRDVMLVDGTLIEYDELVLATGAIPTLPPIRGLVRMDGSLHPAVHAFRTLDDCNGLLDVLGRLDTPAARPSPPALDDRGGVGRSSPSALDDRGGVGRSSPSALDDRGGVGGRVGPARDERARIETPERAVVVGGGLLGLQVARALSVRGLAVEIVEGGDHLLRSQVGPAAGGVLARSLTKLGTEVYTGARAVRMHDAGAGGAVSLELDNGCLLTTDLVVLTAGGRPATGLAKGAGLEVRRGIVVDDRLTSVTDEHVHAIGDCAQHAGRVHGFVPPAWEQAEVLAGVLAGEPVKYDGSHVVARLRATDLDVAVLGDPEREALAGGEVVEMSNPFRGSHRRLVVCDGPDGPGTPDGPDLAAQLPDDAEVCTCTGATAGAVRACSSLEQARDTTRATTGCGGCTSTVRQLVASRSSPT